MSELLKFQPLQITDASLIHHTWGAQAENFTYLTSPVLATIDLAQNYINQTLKFPASKAYHIMIDGEVCGLVKALVDGHRAQVGYVVDKSYWGKGIATQAVKFITVELNNTPSIQRIWATCALENRGSQRVLEKCGYQREGVLRNWVVYPAQGDRAHDNYVYSL